MIVARIEYGAIGRRYLFHRILAIGWIQFVPKWYVHLDMSHMRLLTGPVAFYTSADVVFGALS